MNTVGDHEPRSSAPGAQVGDVLGRFRVDSRLGAGGMGEVFVATDTQLERQVALKVLRRAERTPEATTRLLREARALARVNHRNVVGVFDAGELGDQPWIAMELIRGQNLRAWLATPRRWTETLRALCDAGRGLAAVHAADLVHRDLKPDNILVEYSGRVVVGDFGLAHGERVEGVRAESSTRLEDSITQEGTVLGTPAYMAPEQADGRADARSDQYSFAVTAWEALSGTRPTLATDAAMATTGGPAARGRPDGRVPVRVWRALEQARSADPAKRFASMNALVGELEAALPRSRAMVWALVGAVALSGGAAWLVARPASCDTGPALFASSWSAERRTAVRRALEQPATPEATKAATLVDQALDAFATRWVTMHHDACVATTSGAQSATVLDARMACLQRRRGDFDALVSRLATQGKDLADRAPGAARGLGDLADCADVVSLGERLPVPTEKKAAVTALEAKLSDLKALDDLGQYREMLAPGAQLVSEAQAVDYEPLLGAALRELGLAQVLTDLIPQAEANFDAAAAAAERGHDDRLRVIASLDRAELLLGVRRLPECERALAMSGAIAERIGDKALQRRVRGLGADLAAAEGHLDDAVRLSTQLVAEDDAQQPPDDHVLLGDLNTLAMALRDRGDLEKAEQQLKRAVEVARRALSPKDPGLAMMLAQHADTLGLLRRTKDGLAEHEEALAIFSAAVGPETEAVALHHANWGELLLNEGAWDDARKELERSLAIRRAIVDEPKSRLASSVRGLARLAANTEHLDEANRRMEEVLALDEAAYGPNHPRVVTDLSTQAYFLLRSGNVAAATKRSEAAEARLAEAEKSGAGLGKSERALMQHNRAAVLVAVKRYADARTELTSAYALARAQLDDPTLVIHLDVLDALVRWESDHDVTALERATGALAAARALPDPEAEQEALDVIARIKAGAPRAR